MRVILFLLCVFAMMPRMVFADVRLAVLDFRGVRVEEGLLLVLADEVRSGILNVSKGQKINGQKLLIMTRENMMQVLKDQGLSAEDCTGECEVEIAKNIGADYVVSGTLTKVGSIFVLGVKLHSTSDSNLLASESLKTKSEENLLVESERIGGKVFQEGLNLSSTTTLPSESSTFSNSGSFSSSTTNFGSGIQVDIQQKLKEKKCREFAEEEAKKQRSYRIDNEVQRLQREASNAWGRIRDDLYACLELDLEDREPCQKGLNEWYAQASNLKVVLNSGSETIETDCGLKEEVFGSMSRSVAVDELKEAREIREKLGKPNPKSTSSKTPFQPKSNKEKLQEGEYKELQASEVMIRKKVDPVFPKRARRKGIKKARCLVRFYVDATGKPEQVSIKGCSSIFYSAVENAALKWRFRPPTSKLSSMVAIPVKSTFRVQITLKRRN